MPAHLGVTMSDIPLPTTSILHSASDDSVRFDAALLYAQGDGRGAINTLIQRVNTSNGRCDTKIWLMLLDIYRLQGQQAPYEKLAVFFADRFNFSPPAWEPFENPSKPKAVTGQWRNALIVEGSVLDVHDEKLRDFIRASRDMNSARLDISRMRVDFSDADSKRSLDKLLEVMQRIRRVGCPTLLMGEGALAQALQGRLARKGTDLEQEGTYWMLLLEIAQWRGQEETFDALAMDFADIFSHCPVGYDADGAIAVAPSAVEAADPADPGRYSPEEVVLDARPLLEHIQQHWDRAGRVDIALSYVVRIGVEAARDIAEFLRVHHDGAPAPDGGEGDDQAMVVFHDAPEILAALLEATGVTAFAGMRHRHGRLRDLFGQQ